MNTNITTFTKDPPFRVGYDDSPFKTSQFWTLIKMLPNGNPNIGIWINGKDVKMLLFAVTDDGLNLVASGVAENGRIRVIAPAELGGDLVLLLNNNDSQPIDPQVIIRQHSLTIAPAPTITIADGWLMLTFCDPDGEIWYQVDDQEPKQFSGNSIPVPSGKQISAWAFGCGFYPSDKVTKQLS